MPTIDLIINGNTHHISCNDGEETRLKYLANKFSTKLEQIASSLKQADDKTLYLITALILLDEIDEKKNISTNELNSIEQKELITTISNKVLSIKKLLSI